MSDGKKLFLSKLQPDVEAKIIDFNGCKAIKAQLNDMGMHIGSTVTLMGGRGKSGPVVVILEGSRLALGRGIVEKILVQITDG